MQLAAASHSDNPFAAWQIENAAARCNRMAAIITAADCERNRNQIYVDCRCNGCGGLDNQTAPPSLALVWDADKITTTETDTPSGSAATDDWLTVLDEIIDGLYEDPEPGDDFEDVEVDLDDEELLKLFPELAEDPWPAYPRFNEYQKEAPRRAAYRGRCTRCRGYMDNAREHQDDNVFRCVACGWRTSPEYEHNRSIHAVGGLK